MNKDGKLYIVTMNISNKLLDKATKVTLRTQGFRYVISIYLDVSGDPELSIFWEQFHWIWRLRT